MTGTEERIRELTKSMLRKKLYVVLSKGGAAPERIAELLPKHLEYMIGLEKQGCFRLRSAGRGRRQDPRRRAHHPAGRER